jgi:hypothetical protein
MKVARWIFGIAGVYGILVMAPLYFAEAAIAKNDPPGITHVEYFYGFIGITLALLFPEQVRHASRMLARSCCPTTRTVLRSIVTVYARSPLTPIDRY